MRELKLLLSALLFFKLFSPSISAQQSISIQSNSNGLVEYKVQTALNNTIVFILYGDGEFTMQKNAKHKFAPNAQGYTTEAYFLKAYDTIVPTLRRVNTGAVTTGTTFTNPVMNMSGQIDVLTSWAPAFGFDNFFIIAFKNTANPGAVDGCIEFEYDNSEITVKSNHIKVYNNWVTNGRSSSSGGNKQMIKWDFKNLKYQETRFVYIPATVNARVNNNINFSTSYKVDCQSKGGNETNTTNRSFLVMTNPHDPNVKMVNRSCLRPGVPEQRLEYTISFFNDGDGFAKNVFVYDELESLLDPASFKLLDYEYLPAINIINNSVHFNFLNINLPGTQQIVPKAYSYQDATTHVTFSICTLPNLVPGMKINNFASIIFDEQEAFLTTPVELDCTVECLTHDPCLVARAANEEPAGLEEVLAFEVFPNPFGDHITLNFSQEQALPAGFMLELTDFSGKLIRSLYRSNQEIQSFNQQFHVGDLPKGIYMMILRTDQAVYAKKIIKQ